MFESECLTAAGKVCINLTDLTQRASTLSNSKRHLGSTGKSECLYYGQSKLTVRYSLHIRCIWSETSKQSATARFFYRCFKLNKDAYADGIVARVYVPDFFDGHHVPFDHFTNNEAKLGPDFDLHKFLSENERSVRLESIIQAV